MSSTSIDKWARPRSVCYVGGSLDGPTFKPVNPIDSKSSSRLPVGPIQSNQLSVCYTDCITDANNTRVTGCLNGLFGFNFKVIFFKKVQKTKLGRIVLFGSLICGIL